jgi:carbon storage regulator
MADQPHCVTISTGGVFLSAFAAAQVDFSLSTYHRVRPASGRFCSDFPAFLWTQSTLTQQRNVTMLVLSRKAGERLMIGPNIVVTVLEVRGNVVKLGCEAPMDVPIHREELSRRLNGVTAARLPSESPYFAECA